MNHKQIRNTLYASIALWVILLITISVASAALYNIINTDTFVNGVPSSLTVKERAKLVTATVAKTEQSCLAGKCELVNKAKAKVQIKAIIASEVCVPPQTGTWPDCVTPPPPTCPDGTTGTPPNCVPIVMPPVSLMPVVDTTKNVVPAVGYSEFRVKPTGEQPSVSSEGAFRISCAISHMNNDDPMVFPNQQNATHHHSYYGNTSIKYDSDLSNIANVGNSTCNGGIMNRSAYWHPTMIDTVTNAPVIPDGGAIFYYKVGGVVASSIQAPPKGLRMLAGSPKAIDANGAKATKFICINIALQHSNGMAWQKTVPNCGTDTFMQMVVSFPQCWDGKNLDSPNHQDHMAYPNGQTANKCPSTHPVAFPLISLNLNYKIKANGQASKWRLSSDNYAWNGSNAGYSGHADWVNGWSAGFLEGIVKNCLNPSKDAQAHLLCDGRLFD